MKTLKIYTDGGCSGNQQAENLGGWGAILEYGEHQKELFGGEINTTNNRMEMMALLRSFQAVTKENLSIEVFSDSSYLMNCFRERWYETWLKNGWKTSSKKSVENRDLWEQLLPFISRHKIQFYRVKGHINLNSKTIQLAPLHKKFEENNSCKISLDDFKYIIQMNNRADALANVGITSLRSGAHQEVEIR